MSSIPYECRKDTQSVTRPFTYIYLFTLLLCRDESSSTTRVVLRLNVCDCITSLLTGYLYTSFTLVSSLVHRDSRRLSRRVFLLISHDLLVRVHPAPTRVSLPLLHVLCSSYPLVCRSSTVPMTFQYSLLTPLHPLLRPVTLPV